MFELFLLSITQGDMLALDNLRDSMDAQLQEVRVNHEKVLHSDAQSEFVSGLAAAVCHASMINTHHVYQRWLRLWPALQVWLANEEAANYSIYGSAKLEGYIEELMSQLEIRSSLQV